MTRDNDHDAHVAMSQAPSPAHARTTTWCPPLPLRAPTAGRVLTLSICAIAVASAAVGIALHLWKAGQ